MPKKTRKEKILAVQRNQLKRTQPVVTGIETQQPSVFAPVTLKSTVISKIDTEEKIIRHYFVTDLRKSLLIIGAVFALEFFFYFATMSNYLKLGL